MKLQERIANMLQSSADFFRRGSNRVVKVRGIVGGNIREKYLPFADVVFLNACQLVTDIMNDVTLLYKNGDRAKFEALEKFFALKGQLVCDMLYHDGMVVIGHTQAGEQYTQHYFHLCRPNEYRRNDNDGVITFTSMVEGMDVYVMRSPTMELLGVSDRESLHPWLTYLDNVMNASNTCQARLGSVVFATPKTPSGASAPIPLMSEDIKDLEQQLQKDYGALAEQNQICILGEDLNFTTISLAAIDQKTTEKARFAILAIADKIHIPANQVAIIDANGSKALSTGNELREGDFARYQTAERLLWATWIRFAEDMGLSVDYTIYNKPQRQDNGTI